MRYEWVIIDLSFRKKRVAQREMIKDDRQKNANIEIRGESVDCKYRGKGIPPVNI